MTMSFFSFFCLLRTPDRIGCKQDFIIDRVLYMI